MTSFCTRVQHGTASAGRVPFGTPLSACYAHTINGIIIVTISGCFTDLRRPGTGMHVCLCICFQPFSGFKPCTMHQLGAVIWSL
jgi:hypothetical protein